MIGLLINDQEQKEIKYLVKRELEEILFDLEDHRIDEAIKQSMRERYKVLYQLLCRFGDQQDCIRYMLN